MEQALIIDTSLGGMLLATAQLSAESPKMGKYYLCTERRATERELAVKAKELLVDIPPPTKIIVSVGPGSFTGIRAGIAFAAGLAQTSHKLLGIPSLYAIATFLRGIFPPPFSIFLAITADSGVAATARGNAVTIEALTLPAARLNRRKGLRIICGQWPRLRQQLTSTTITIEVQEMLAFAALGMAMVAQQRLDERPKVWPQPLYCKEPYAQSRG